MDRRTSTLLVFAALGVAAIVLVTPLTPLSTTNTISLWSAVEIRCDDLTASTILLRRPSRAILHIDTDPSAPYWPFYYGGIVQVVVNDVVVKSYDPPLLDKDSIDISEHVQMFNRFKVVPKVAAIICNVETQGVVSGHLEVTYPSDGGGGGGGNGGWGGGEWWNPQLIILAGMGLMGLAAFLLWRWR